MPIVQSCGVDHKHFDGGKEEKGKWELPRDCPFCDKGKLNRWASYWRSALADSNAFKHKVKIIRMRCKSCGKTVAVLPMFLAPYQRVITVVRETIVQSWLLGRVCGAWQKGQALT